MKPWIHAQNSAKQFGGIPQDYIAIHDFFDSSKSVFPDMRHRALYHHSFGIYLSERLFGHNLTNSDGQLVSVRDVGEWHCIEDLGKIPTVQDYLESMPFYPWLGRAQKKKRITSVEEMIGEIQGSEKFLRQGREVASSVSYYTVNVDDFMDTASDRRAIKERLVD